MAIGGGAEVGEDVGGYHGEEGFGVELMRGGGEGEFINCGFEGLLFGYYEGYGEGAGEAGEELRGGDEERPMMHLITKTLLNITDKEY